MNAPRRAPRRKVDGVILLDKPSGISSNAALQRVRRLFNAAKGGHTGTLDPLASGLLPLCLGEATKFSQTLLDADKSYEAKLRLGVRTTTGDAEGEVLETRPAEVTTDEVFAACTRFVGEIAQIPPMYSALKVAGRPLYDYARDGVTLERKPRQVHIRRIELLGFDRDTVRLAVDCSKGTYIRVLAEDIGEVLGCGAHLVALRRTRIGRFHIDESVELSQIEANPDCASRWLLPVDHLLADWPSVLLDESAAGRFAHGQTVPASAGIGDVPVRVYGPSGRFVGAADHVGGVLHPRRLLGSGE
ncbi:MAG: tRNA pseudouridine(55) synthase TruB [Sterolibacteriaceae bacterium]|nr:tRNA pseudouridine(55) synthase TruB [Candidatus Methylophosphatis haderslevensis]